MGFEIRGSGFRVHIIEFRVQVSSELRVEGFTMRFRPFLVEGARITARACVQRLISQKVFVKSFLKSQFPHKSVN